MIYSFGRFQYGRWDARGGVRDAKHHYYLLMRVDREIDPYIDQQAWDKPVARSHSTMADAQRSARTRR